MVVQVKNFANLWDHSRHLKKTTTNHVHCVTVSQWLTTNHVCPGSWVKAVTMPGLWLFCYRKLRRHDDFLLAQNPFLLNREIPWGQAGEWGRHISPASIGLALLVTIIMVNQIMVGAVIWIGRSNESLNNWKCGMYAPDSMLESNSISTQLIP